MLAHVDVNAESQDEDGEDDEENECVDDDGLAVGGQSAALEAPVVARNLEQQTRRQQDEEYQAQQHRCPIQHFLFFSVLSCFFYVYVLSFVVANHCRPLYT